MNKSAIIGLFVLLLLGIVPALQAQKEFPVWSEKVFDHIGENYGVDAANRLRSAYNLVREHLNEPVDKQLEVVNDYMNQLTWIADSDLWKKTDYWATPFETITTFGGDCEDIAIAKYMALRLMGVPDEHLGFAHVVTMQREHHMVLVYKSPDRDTALILDNQNPKIKSAKERTDLIGVYIFQNDGTVYIIKDEGDAQRTIQSRKENLRLEKWLTAKDRARENIKNLTLINGGPVMPEWMIQPK